MYDCLYPHRKGWPAGRRSMDRIDDVASEGCWRTLDLELTTRSFGTVFGRDWLDDCSGAGENGP